MELVEVIDYEGEVGRNWERGFTGLGLTDAGNNYSVVTVLGCQSSGKSTLLNAMFGTSFPEMNSQTGRRQTTRGLWAASDKETPTVVIDVEGTDSKERGEEGVTFEHRASLFALAIADTVFVNMWYNDIGRYKASNYQLLGTVFAANVDLFVREVPKVKTTLLFVVRDWSPDVTPLSVLERDITADIQKIWSDMKKPAHIIDNKVTANDLFRFVVVGLPSRIVERASFERAVAELRLLWLNQVRPSEYTRGVPADGFALYAASVWNTIASSADLDIPSQREMVALFRCDRIRYETLNAALPALLHTVDVEGAEFFSSPSLIEGVKSALNAYHKQAWRYDTKVYRDKRSELLSGILAELQRAYDRNLYDIRRDLLREARDVLQSAGRRNLFVPGTMLAEGITERQFWRELPEQLHKWRSAVNEKFKEHTSSTSLHTTVKLDEGDEEVEVEHIFDVEVGAKLLREGLQEIEDKFLQQERAAFEKYLQPEFVSVRKRIEANLLEPSLSRYWESATHMAQELCEKIRNNYGDVLCVFYQKPGMAYQFTEKGSERAGAVDGQTAEGQMANTTRDTSEDEGAQTLPKLSLEDEQMVVAVLVWLGLRSELERRVERGAELVADRFGKHFGLDASGAPNFWPSLSQDQIKKLFTSARQAAYPAVDLVTSYGIQLRDLLPPSMVPADEKEEVAIPTWVAPSLSIEGAVTEMSRRSLVPDVTREEIALAAERIMVRECTRAQFEQATGGGGTSAPLWMWGLLIALVVNLFLPARYALVFGGLLVALVLAVVVSVYYLAPSAAGAALQAVLALINTPSSSSSAPQRKN